MSQRRKIVSKLDGWAHFHRFEWRLLCDVHDWVHGLPWDQVRKSTKDKESAHRKAKSFHNHPSQREFVDG